MKFSLTLVPPLVSSPTKGGALVRIYRRCAALQKSNQFCTMGKRQPRAAAAAPNCELSKWAASGWDAPAEHTWKLTPTAPTLFFSRCNGGSQRRLWVRGCSSRTNVCLFFSFRRPLCMESCSPYKGAEVWFFSFCTQFAFAVIISFNFHFCGFMLSFCLRSYISPSRFYVKNNTALSSLLL